MAKLAVTKTYASAQDFRFPMCCSWAIFCQTPSTKPIKTVRVAKINLFISRQVSRKL